MLFFFFFKLNNNPYSSITLSFHMEKAFSIQNLVKPQMALEEKPQNVLLIISKYQLTGRKKRRRKKKSHSKFMYTYT